MIKSAIAGALTGTLTSRSLREARRRLAAMRRRIRGAPVEVHYFHQVDDPYSQLAAQTLPSLVESYEIELVPHLVGAPPDEAAPEREKLEAFARKDAADIAPAYGLSFARPEGAPAPAAVALATRILAAAGRDDFVRHAAAIGEAVWAGDESRLHSLASDLPLLDEPSARAVVEEGNRLRSELGHYLGGMFYCDPEWYWGVDRLHYLEERLGEMGRTRKGVAAPVVRRREGDAATAPAPRRRLQLEFYLSLRSPYTAISMSRVFDLGRRYPVDIILRPVLPMVMRGLPVPLAKRIYIVLDTKREADHAGIPFGRVCDPVGEPVERGFSLYHWARDQGRAEGYLQSFAESVFAEGVDAGSERGLQRIVERAGLSWQEAQRHRDDRGWREELEANREQLFSLGLWGVPSFRLLGDGAEQDFCTWGQDRLWLVEQEIQRRIKK